MLAFAAVQFVYVYMSIYTGMCVTYSDALSFIYNESDLLTLAWVCDYIYVRQFLIVQL